MSNSTKRKEYEKYFRIHKIHTLSKAIDKTVYDLLAAVPLDSWRKFAIAVEANPPSTKTVAALLQRYRRRYMRRYVEKKPK